MKKSLSLIPLKTLVVTLAIVTSSVGRVQTDNVLRDGSKFLLERLAPFRAPDGSMAEQRAVLSALLRGSESLSAEQFGAS
jgi:hypothetical protein